MIHLFLRLFLLTFLSVGVFQFTSLNPLKYFAEHSLEKFLADQFKGVEHDLRQVLTPLDQDAREEWVQANNQHFNYRLKLGNAETFDLNNAQRRDLESGNHVFSYAKPVWLFIPIKGNSAVLRLQINESDTEVYAQSAKGVTWVIAQEIGKFSTLTDGLQAAQSHVGFPLKSFQAHDLTLNNEQKAQLTQQKLLTVEDEITHQFTIYFLYESITQGSWVILAGPINETSLKQQLQITQIGSILLMLLLPIILWLLLFWRELRLFNRTARRYGAGQLDARMSLPKGSALYLPGQAFNTMARDVQRLIESHKTLVNAVSHELKAPVARLAFALEMLRDSVASDDQARYQDALQHNISELKRRIQELLLYARYDRPITLKRLEHAEIEAWYNGIIEPFKQAHPHITLTQDPQRLESITMDQNAMRHVLINLLDNAENHCRTHVFVKISAQGDHYQLIVEDDGDGIAPEDRERIFEPFRRLDHSRQRSTGGTGLGLAIVRQIARQHGGDVVCCKGTQLAGAVFYVTWPKE